MTADLAIGIGLTLVAGVMSGNCMLPSKFVRAWAWENMWLVFSLVSLVFIPWGLALALVPDLGGVYAGLSAGQLAVPFVFGAGWGVAQVLFGLSIARLGLALGYAIIVGLGAVLGTLVPMFVQKREVLGTGKGALILSGIAVMAAGIVVSGWAGRRREKPAKRAREAGGSYAGALLIAFICGLLAPMLNYSFAFGQDIAKAAIERGASAQNAGYAVWPVSLAGGLVPNALYSLWLLNRNGTWGKFRPAMPDLKFPAAMGILWMGAFATYGVASVYLGPLGTSAGWALMQIFMILTANVSGLLTGEWRGTPPRVLRVFGLGLSLLALATVIISLGNR